MTKRNRIIFHLDMNSFYASVEQAHNPSLKGKPIAVAGNPKERRGILVTCSYEARARGIYTTMSVWEAKRKCPELILLPPNFESYRAASKAMFDILRSYTPMVEPVSIDEGYIDLTDVDIQNDAVGFAKSIQQRILRELDLPCSIGIAPNKFLAKTASNMKKPMGITVLRKREVSQQLWHLPVIEMHGVGESTSKKLESLGIITIGNIASANPEILKSKLGKAGARLYNRSHGIDDREVNPESIFETKSVGNSTTLPYDETNMDELQKVLRRLSGKVASRLESKNLAGRSITIHIRDASWKNKTRSKTVTNRLFKEDEIFQLAFQLFESAWNSEPIRLLGVTVNNVFDKGESVEQLSIFNYEEHAKEEPILKLVEQLQTKFGAGIIKRGIKLDKKPSFESKTSFSKDFLDDHER
ncbi:MULTISPECIES: DNA polymerase IV [unclassified Psychrobacillus]|uniref:DNA polymerase IV n=1 Tax=unclassified Psychrobacillus TaxID=2636677 RepID=UPI00146A4CEE|nr:MULTISPECIES: DNA polymerase IV [unclassified Psychrobacillus]MCM3357130.1 DNA polymerase IV [Psychrobacillus sp. MER TA 171]NME04447.1 DNA polymerase IV [Psychrobacillus sp. BL-248-WT-3]